jgi:1-deoxy-D-xylulose-5-phosphate reductoisomerase
LSQLGQLSFEKPDLERFPCLALAQHALRVGGASPTILNAANEVAVEAFLARKISFSDIAGVVESVLTRSSSMSDAPASIEVALSIDAGARTRATDLLPT